MTVVNPKSISGINSITTGSGSDDILTIHTNNGTERLRVDSTGATKIVTGIVTTLTATTGIVTTLTANTVTSLGAVSGTTGTFSGAVSGTTGTFTSHVSLGDSDELRIGDSADLKIYHTGSQSRIENSGTGELRLQGDTIQITDKEANDMHILCTHDGAVSLYYDNSAKLATTSTGVTISGSDTTGSVVQGDFRFKNASGTQHIVYDASESRINFADSAKVTFGNANDLKIYHDGSGSYIDNEVGALKVRDTGGVTKISVYGSGTVFSNTTDDAAMNDCILLTRRGYEFSGYGTKIQAMGGSADSQNGIRFAHSINNGGGYTVRQRFDHDGIKFNGDTAADNALDDYEEGTFTPTLLGQYSGQSYSNQVGQYTKIGNVVVANVYLKLAGDPGSYASGISIGGLPFTGINNNALAGAGVLAYQASAFPSSGTNANFSAMVNSNDTVMKLYTPDGTFLLWSEMNDRTEQMRFNITYRTA